jgi:phosphatidylserine/phosphatidylglycerophosphate/cardiolipin synthase-like enzyme
MRLTTLAISAVLLLSACILFARAPRSGDVVADEGIAVYFSPKGGWTEAIVEQIGKARASIDVQAYSFTSTDIAKALADAEVRGVKVRAILDKTATGEHYTGGTYLADHQERSRRRLRHAFSPS